MTTSNEWDTEANELTWTHNGMQCHIQRAGETYHLCGYVEVPRTNAAYKKDYDDVGFDAHGGLTFAGPAYWYSGETAEGLDWWLGFDCAHHGDLTPYDVKRWGKLPNEHQVYRNMAYVKAECERLADQIAAYVVEPETIGDDIATLRECYRRAVEVVESLCRTGHTIKDATARVALIYNIAYDSLLLAVCLA